MTDLPLTTCRRCKARSAEEAETKCRPQEDESGERWCPGTEWPLEQLWAGEITEAEAAKMIEAEDAALIAHHARECDNGGPNG